MSNEGTWRRLINKDGTPGKWELRVQRFVGDDDRKLSFFGETKQEAKESLAHWETVQREKWAAKRQGYNRERKLAILDILEAGHPAKPFMDGPDGCGGPASLRAGGQSLRALATDRATHRSPRDPQGGAYLSDFQSSGAQGED
jgi:hypothetical protein